MVQHEVGIISRIRGEAETGIIFQIRMLKWRHLIASNKRILMSYSIEGSQIVDKKIILKSKSKNKSNAESMMLSNYQNKNQQLILMNKNRKTVKILKLKHNKFLLQ